MEATEAIADVRAQVARLLGAVDERGRAQASDIIFTRNASESLNLVAKSFAPCVLEPGDEVAITIMEHHSNLIPWQQACRAAGATLVYLYPDAEGRITREEIAAKVGPRTKIVACAHVSNVLGVENPVSARSPTRCMRTAATSWWTGRSPCRTWQSTCASCMRISSLSPRTRRLDPWASACCGDATRLLEQMPPMLTGGEMIDSVTEQDAVWAPVPEKFEAGTQDAAGIYATGAALAYLTETVGYEAVASREAALVAYTMDRLATLPYVDIIGSNDPAYHHGVVSFNVQGIHPHDVASILDMDGVCIRAGHHCAQPLLTWLGVENLACCRASLAFYNDAEDVDRFIDGLKTVWSTFHA